MKKSLKYFIGITILLFINMVNILAQDPYEESVSSINFVGSSAVQSVSIIIKENTQNFDVVVNSTVKKGSVTIEIIDPNGNKFGNFSIEAQSGSDDKKPEKAAGMITKSILSPMKGEWEIKIMPMEADGAVRISSKLYKVE
jgi:hypothetical protein